MQLRGGFWSPWIHRSDGMYGCSQEIFPQLTPVVRDQQVTHTARGWGLKTQFCEPKIRLMHGCHRESSGSFRGFPSWSHSEFFPPHLYFKHEVKRRVFPSLLKCIFHWFSMVLHTFELPQSQTLTKDSASPLNTECRCLRLLWAEAFAQSVPFSGFQIHRLC